MSERRASRVLGQPRAVQRYTALMRVDEVPLRLLFMMDERTRECLPIDVARQLGSNDVLEQISWRAAMRGVPDHVRNGIGT